MKSVVNIFLTAGIAERTDAIELCVVTGCLTGTLGREPISLGKQVDSLRGKAGSLVKWFSLSTLRLLCLRRK